MFLVASIKWTKKWYAQSSNTKSDAKKPTNLSANFQCGLDLPKIAAGSAISFMMCFFCVLYTFFGI